MKLKYIKRKNIDTQKWDLCVKNSKNSLIYAYSWYLDIVAENWSGIISEDYNCVMPIIWNRKFGIKYTYRAFLVQQLGVFCSNEQKIEYSHFLKKLYGKFLFVDYNFNIANNIDNIKTSENKNYELNLNKTYDELWQNFSKKHQASIKKSRKNNLQLSENLKIDDLIELKKKYLPNNLNQKNFETLKTLCEKYPQKAKIFGAYKNNELLSASLYFIFDSRIYFLASVSSKKGKKLGSAFFLKDRFIEQYSNKKLILDFEGSNIPGVSHFFKGWNAKPSFYQTIKSNFLNFKIKKIK